MKNISVHSFLSQLNSIFTLSVSKMASSTSFTLPYIFVSFALVLIVKSILFLILWTSISDLFSLPGIFFIDVTVMLIFAFLSYFGISRIHNSKAYKLASSIILIAMSWQSLVAVLCFVYFVSTRNFVDWFAMGNMMTQDFKTFSNYVKTFGSWIIVIFAVFAALIVLKVKIAKRLQEYLEGYSVYLPLRDTKLENESSSPRIGNRKILTFCSAFLLSFVSYEAFVTREEHVRLSENYLVSLPWAYTERAVRRHFRNDQSSKRVWKLQQSNSTLSSSEIKAKLPPIKNVVLILMESLRSDILDFDPNTVHGKHLASMLSDPKYVSNFDDYFSPFLNKLKHKSMFFPAARTAAGYTIKSTMSSVCSVFPLPELTTEHKKKIYAKCLPEILKEYGNFSTFFANPASSDFDHWGEMVTKFGFDKTMYVSDLPKQKWVNYFGVDDRKMIPKVMDFATTARNNKNPFFATFVTNAGHHPFNVPDGYNKTQFVNDKKYSVQNDYLNAVNNVDGFVKDLFAEFEKQDLMNDTLFVFVGDHGMGLGDHGVVGTGEGFLEESFKVPLLFYSPVFSDWGSSIGNRRQIPVSNIDILPTVLDILNIDLPNDKHEGRSLLLPEESFQNRTLYIISNPANRHSQIIIQNNWKLVKDVRAEKFRFFDLSADPFELNGYNLPSDKLGRAQLDWIEYAKSEIQLIDETVKGDWAQ